MKKIIFLSLCFLLNHLLLSQSTDSEFSSWLLNTTGITGYNGLPANVQKVQYSQNYVYISCSGIPAYSIGPWPGDPNVAEEQDFVFKLPRNPKEETGTKLSTPLGAIGVLINGVAIFNSEDANSYNNQNVWHSNAVIVEASSFDDCLGHPQMNGIYHYHENPICLYSMDSTKHSPIIGYAFDGFPIYGTFGYANPDGTGGIKRMISSYRLKNITKRTSLPDGTQLSPSEYGPDVSTQYPLGYYVEDYEYVDSSGDLDQYNGRFTVTPEYPNGTYAYFVTTNNHDSSTYPYIIGPKYYGTVVGENIQTQGHVSISEPVTDYSPTTGVNKTNINPLSKFSLMQNYPNPFNPTTIIEYSIPSSGTISSEEFGQAGSLVTLNVYDIFGRHVATLVNKKQTPGRYTVRFNGSYLSSGIYFYELHDGNLTLTKKLILLK
jgi:YHYH protein/Secretion system C-terminal sorting domain